MGMAQDDRNLYVSDWGIAGGDTGSVSRVDKSTGQVTVAAARQSYPLGIAVDAREIFWLTGHGSVGPTPFAEGTVRRIAKDAVSTAGR
jgi:hypothetical protein